MIGIIVAPVVILVVTLILALVVIHRRRRAALELASKRSPERSTLEQPIELGAMDSAVELVGGEVELELDGEGRHEFPATGLYELSTENLRERPDKAQYG